MLDRQRGRVNISFFIILFHFLASGGVSGPVRPPCKHAPDWARVNIRQRKKRHFKLNNFRFNCIFNEYNKIMFKKYKILVICKMHSEKIDDWNATSFILYLFFNSTWFEKGILRSLKKVGEFRTIFYHLELIQRTCNGYPGERTLLPSSSARDYCHKVATS